MNFKQFSELMDIMEELIDLPIETLRKSTNHPKDAENEKLSRGLCMREILEREFVLITTGNSLGITLTKVS